MDTADLHDFFDALGAGDFERVSARLNEDVVLEFPGRRFGGTFTGRRAVTVFMRQNQRLFRNGLKFQVHWAGVAGDRGVVQWTNAGVTRAGAEYRNRGVTVFLFREGRIAQIQDYLDTEALSLTWPAAGERAAEQNEK
ncbi:MAG: nuclear transport factor 2 family protein [Planctomycetes bacterium]|nr:nuclear transport factor 2 family protein [Planctomycetota bacterium]